MSREDSTPVQSSTEVHASRSDDTKGAPYHLSPQPLNSIVWKDQTSRVQDLKSTSGLNSSLPRRGLPNPGELADQATDDYHQPLTILQLVSQYTQTKACFSSPKLAITSGESRTPKERVIDVIYTNPLPGDILFFTNDMQSGLLRTRARSTIIVRVAGSLYATEELLVSRLAAKSPVFSARKPL
jgi:hypothetical protein